MTMHDADQQQNMLYYTKLHLEEFWRQQTC